MKNVTMILGAAVLLSGQVALAASLTPEEVQQYADDLGVVLTPTEQQAIADLVKPDTVPSWRTDAEARIDQHRKADLTVQVVDANGDPLDGVQVNARLKDHDFKFSGVLRVKDLTDADGKLDGISTNHYQEVFTKLYNGAGLNNGFKQKHRNGFEEYLPGFLNWAQSIDMPVRGHLLIWPGGNSMTAGVTEKVEALETLWDGIYPSVKYGTAETNETVAVLDVAAGDLVAVIVASNVGGSPVETNVVLNGSASLSSVVYDRISGKGPSVATWYSHVQSDGTVEVDFIKGPSYQNIMVYHLTPDGGPISLLDADSETAKDLLGITNSYNFGSSSSGIILEGISAYAADVYPEGEYWVYTSDKRRRFAHRYFSGSTFEESIWTHEAAGTIAINGLAFANARVAGEQEAELQEPVLQQELKDQIRTEMIEWASLWSVYEWDVINETRDRHRIQDLIGWDQMAEWFRIASSNSVQPGCDLLLNEYGVISAEPASVNPTGYTSRRDTMMSHLDIIQANGGPMSRIGFQSRMTRGYVEPNEIYSRLDEFGNRYGLPMVGTEFEVREKDTFPVDETLRAQITEETLTTYFSHPLVAGLTAWTYMGTDDWVMANYDGHIKLNGLVWYYLHRIRYVTDEDVVSNASGEAAVRGFKGDYEITVSYDGKEYPVEYTLLSNQTAVVALNDVNVPEPTEEILDEWNFDLAHDGDKLNNARTASSINGDVFGNRSMAYATNQLVHFEATGVGDESVFTDEFGASYAGISTGLVQISWDVTAADFSNTYALTNTASAQGGFGIRDTLSGNRDNRALLRYQNNKFYLVITDSGGLEYSDVVTGTTALSNLNIRLVYDFDNAGSAGSFRVYTSFGGGAETEHKPNELSLHAGFVFERFRVQFQALNGNNLWQPGDFMDVDNIRIARLLPGGEDSPESLYADWLVSLGYTSNTNLLEDANGDGMNNLVDYAVGGLANLPVEYLQEDYLQYVHIQRNDADASMRGLSYTVESCSNLVGAAWSTNEVEFVGSAALDDQFDTVTNQVPLVGSEQYIRLKIKMN